MGEDGAANSGHGKAAKGAWNAPQTAVLFSLMSGFRGTIRSSPTSYCTSKTIGDLDNVQPDPNNPEVFAEEFARTPGFLQRFDPRVRVVGLGFLIVGAASVQSVPVLFALLTLTMVLASASKVPVRILMSKVWMPALSFSGMIAFPAIFLVNGIPLFHVPVLGWIVTQQGLTTASLLILRVATAATFSALIVLTTEWMRVLRALRFIRIPVVAVVILGMTYRYLFLLLRTAHEMFESRQSRPVGTLEGHERRRLAAARVGVLISKSFQLSSQVHSAMLARGFRAKFMF